MNDVSAPVEEPTQDRGAPTIGTEGRPSPALPVPLPVARGTITENGVDHDLFTLNLVVGTREDITAGRWEELWYEQQC